MPPKVKVQKDDIIRAALALVRERGADALNARDLAAVLGCSTQPIFSNFASMEELLSVLYQTAHEQYLLSLEDSVRRGDCPPYKAFGMAYIRFAAEERELFKMLFMCERKVIEAEPSPDITASVEMIMRANGVTRESAERMHLEMWACVHGIAAMIATSFLTLPWDVISDMLSDIYAGLQHRHKTKEEQ